MGRDTVVDSKKPLGPRGTQVLPSGQSEMDAEPADGPNGQVVVVGNAKLPKSATNRKIDVSKVDPRRMPTNVLAKRPSKFQAPDRGEPGEAAAVAPAAGGQRWLFWLGVASLIALAFCALALGWFVHLRQQGRL